MSGKEPLSGIKILDLCRFQNGPVATSMLRDYGAECIKIEAPGMGDTGRGSQSRDGFQHYFEALNRGYACMFLYMCMTMLLDHQQAIH